MTEISRPTSGSTVYYRGNLFISLLIAGSALLFVFVIPLHLFVSVFFVFVAALFTYSAFQIRLIVSPTGITYHQVGYSVRTAWENISRIGDIPAGRIVVEGLILHESGLHVSSWLVGVPYIHSRGKLIPLSLFRRDWRTSQLGQQIKEYAPHLIAKGN